MTCFANLLYLTMSRSSRKASTTTKFHITIPIFYVNSDPHIGHLYSAVLADVAFRWRLLRDNKFTTNIPENYLFCAGTDEHGKKIFNSALAKQLTPKQHCDQYSERFKHLFKKFGILNQTFVRTTSPFHIEAVLTFWRKLQDDGHIYKSNYEGWYSIVDECFYSDFQVENGFQGMVAIESKSPVSKIVEENYVFNLAKFYDSICDWISKPNVIRPQKLIKDVQTFMNSPTLGQLSISRPTHRCNWGIPVPSDPSQTIYVWFDALVNYLTAVGYPNQQPLHSWPPSLQILGKDIFRFHAIYWPAFLLAAGLPLPNQLFVHAHLLVDKKKMSKSLGNVLCPFKAADHLTVDGLRYCLLIQNSFEDGNFTLDEAINVVNAYLVNDLANLLQRAINPKLNPTQQYPNGFEPDLVKKEGTVEKNKTFKKLIEELETLPERIVDRYESLEVNRVLEILVNIVQLANQFFQQQTPWKLNLQERINSILFITYEVVRMTAIFLLPVTPNFSHKLLSILGIAETERTLKMAKFNNNSMTDEIGQQKVQKGPEPIFPRIVFKQSV